MPVTAYIPCCDNAATIAAAVDGIRRQTVPVDEFFVIDDGSSDGSTEILASLGVRVIRHERALGRGAVRARALEEAAHPLVLSSDATNRLASDFLERSLHWFESEKVAAVFGRLRQSRQETAADRWRGRHLFKTSQDLPLNRRASLSTWGVVLRKSSVLAAGNFDPRLRHSEDADLGARLLARGDEVVFDPSLDVAALNSNTLPQVLERYWRWYAGVNERMTLKGYMKQIVYSIKVMAREDLQEGDPASACVSLLSPHYQFWNSWFRRMRGVNQQ
ncbi:MAG TPA: glycosyltransferase [Acidobacteriaceae bacterium]|jgi:glycosyltransferase involved in cell wall biosynthesis